MPEPVALGRAAPPCGHARLLFEDARFEELSQVVADCRRVDSEEPGEFGNLAGRLLERLYDGQAVGVSEEAVSLCSDAPRNASIHDYDVTIANAAVPSISRATPMAAVLPMPRLPPLLVDLGAGAGSRTRVGLVR